MKLAKSKRPQNPSAQWTLSYNLFGKRAKLSGGFFNKYEAQREQKRLRESGFKNVRVVRQDGYTKDPKLWWTK